MKEPPYSTNILLSAYCVSVTVLGTGKTAVNKTKFLSSWSLHSTEWNTRNKEANTISQMVVSVTENTINSTTPTLQDESYSHFLDSRKPHFNEAK